MKTGRAAAAAEAVPRVLLLLLLCPLQPLVQPCPGLSWQRQRCLVAPRCVDVDAITEGCQGRHGLLRAGQPTLVGVLVSAWHCQWAGLAGRARLLVH